MLRHRSVWDGGGTVFVWNEELCLLFQTQDSTQQALSIRWHHGTTLTEKDLLARLHSEAVQRGKGVPLRRDIRTHEAHRHDP